MSNDVSVTAQKTRKLIESKWPEICKSLPQHVTPERMLRVFQNAFGKNTKLLECTPQSLMAAIVLSSELGLEVNTPLGYAFIIPYGDEATFQIGYKGIIDLCLRSGKVLNISAEIVYEKDTFKQTLGLHRDLIHEPFEGDRGAVRGYYAVVDMAMGASHFAYMTAHDCNEHAKRFSKAYQYDLAKGKKSSAWTTNFDSQALKTVIIKALKYAPRAIEDSNIRRAIEGDEGYIDVPASIIEPETKDETRANLLTAAKDLISRYKDIPGGLSMDDLEGHLGGDIAGATDDEVAEAINTIRLKCQTIAEMQKQFPDWKPKTPAIQFAGEDLDAMWNDLKDGN